MDIGARPGELDGCWQSWQEKDIQQVIKTEMDSGALHTRRRFTGVSRVVNASVTLEAGLHDIFMTWFRVNQQQGAIPTYVVNPQGVEEVFQWLEPPQINWVDKNAFIATVQMYQGSWF